MSKNLSLAWKLAGVVTLGFGVGVVTVKTLEEPRRVPSGSFEFASEVPPLMEKSYAALHIDLRAPAGIPESENEEVHFKARVRLNETPENPVELKWELPEGVSVVSGDVIQYWNDLNPGETREVELVLKGFSKENLKHLGLHGRFRAGGREFGNSSFLSSRPEDSLELVSGARAEIATGEAMKASSEEEAPSRRPLLKGRILR